MSLSTNTFFPTLTATLGYNRTVTLLLCAPPWLFAIIAALVVTKPVLSILLWKKLQTHAGPQAFRCHGGEILARGRLFCCWTGWVRDCIFHRERSCAVHFPVSDTNSLPSVEDSMICPPRFLMAESRVAIILFWVWVCSMFSRRPSKRAVAIALINGFVALSNIPGSYIWPKKWGDSYRYSYAICIATNGLSIVMILGFRARLKAPNEKAEREEREQDLPRGYRYLL